MRAVNGCQVSRELAFGNPQMNIEYTGNRLSNRTDKNVIAGVNKLQAGEADVNFTEVCSLDQRASLFQGVQFSLKTDR